MFNLEILPTIAIIAAFFIIVAASKQLGILFEKIKLPLITGFIVIGAIAGPYVLNMTPKDLSKLNFINEIALGFIALAAGAEMYLKEIRDRSKQIFIMTSSQLIITFIISFILLYIFIDLIPFAQTFTQKTVLAFALLSATIFVAPSLATTIPIINELRAKGPFTKTALGVTVFKDIFLIIIFSITFAISDILIIGGNINPGKILIVILNLAISIAIGLLYALIYKFVFKLKKPFWIEVILFLLAGWTTFLLSQLVTDISNKYLHIHIHLEAVLIGITASFYIVNYTSFRANVNKLVEDIGPYIYVAFFTLVGATLSLDSLKKYWIIAIILFLLRLILTILSSAVGSIISRDNRKETMLSWTPHIAQAGISLGLISIVAMRFSNSFGKDFEAVMVAMIVINQFVGPPLMRFAIVKLKEAHTKSTNYEANIQRNVAIIGLSRKSIFLSKALSNKGDNVTIVCDKELTPDNDVKDVKIARVEKINKEALKNLNFKSIDSVIILRTDEQAYKITEIIYENFGTPNVVVQVKDRSKIKQFRELGAIVVEPTSAIINLMAHFVQSPQATSILMGMEKNQNSEDVEILTKDIHGMALRDINLPLGILILSITRNEQVMLPHGYTRLRMHDIVTIIGSSEHIDIVKTKLQY